MSIVRAKVSDGGMLRDVMPGDVLAGGEATGNTLTTVGAGTWTAALIAAGIITRTGPVGGFTDTTDSADNIIAALAGNNAYGLVGNTPVVVGAGAQPDVSPGTSFRLLVQNFVAQALTWAAGEGVVAGTGTVNIAASLWREYLVTIINSTRRTSQQCTNGNAVKLVTLSVPQPMGTITPGMTMSGTNITAGTKVVGLTLNGSGLISAVTTDTNTAGANAASVALVFSPTVKFDGLRSGTA